LRHARTYEAVKIRLDEWPGDLSRPIRAIIHEHHDVAVANTREPTAGWHHAGGLHELIGFAARIGLVQRADGIGRFEFGAAQGH